MSKADEWRAMYNQYRALFEKAATAIQTLSDAEQAELKSAVAQLERLAQYLGFQVEAIDPSIVAAAKAAAIFDAHYRRKAELDRKFLEGDVP